MGELFRVRQHAGPGTSFGPDAFKNMVGGVVPVTVPPDDHVVDGVLRSVFVPDGGRYADLVLEVPDGTLPAVALAQLGVGRSMRE